MKNNAFKKLMSFLISLERKLKTNRRILVAVLGITIFAGIVSFLADVSSLMPEKNFSLKDAGKNDFELVATLYENTAKDRPIIHIDVSHKQGEFGMWPGGFLTYYASVDGEYYNDSGWQSIPVHDRDLMLRDSVYIKLEDAEGEIVGPWKYNFDFEEALKNLAIKEFEENSMFRCMDIRYSQQKTIYQCRFSIYADKFEGLMTKIEYSFNEDFSDINTIEFPERELADRLTMKDYSKSFNSTDERELFRFTGGRFTGGNRNIYYKVYLYDGSETKILSQRV